MTDDYLSRLPSHLTVTGDHRKGEIELLPSEEKPGFGVVYEDKYVLLVRDRVRFPGGKEGSYLRLINASELSGGAGTVMVPIWQGQMAWVHIFRHATRTWEWELPRGFLEPGNSEETNAEKEIWEELGVKSKSVTRIGEFNPNTGLMSGIIGVYQVELASDPVSAGQLQAEEGIAEVRLVAPENLMDFIAQQGVRCGISLAAAFFTVNRKP